MAHHLILNFLILQLNVLSLSNAPGMEGKLLCHMINSRSLSLRQIVVLAVFDKQIVLYKGVVKDSCFIVL